jgi:hypothetical protein
MGFPFLRSRLFGLSLGGNKIEDARDLMDTVSRGADLFHEKCSRKEENGEWKMEN